MKIEGKGLRKAFKEKVLFENLNFMLDSGQLVALYGESGCGKTTLLNMIAQIEPYEGEILLDGQVLKKSQLRSFRGKELSMIFQNYGLIEDETVEANIKLMDRRYSRKEWKKKIDEVLKKVNLEGYEKRKIVECSGGEQQRVAIAKSLLKSSNIILADEPTASLDDENKKAVMKLFRKIADDGKIIVVVTHDKEVLGYCDAVIEIA